MTSTSHNIMDIRLNIVKMPDLSITHHETYPTGSMGREGDSTGITELGNSLSVPGNLHSVKEEPFFSKIN